MDHGKITEMGSYSELVDDGETFAKFLKEFATKQDVADEEEDIEGKHKSR